MNEAELDPKHFYLLSYDLVDSTQGVCKEIIKGERVKSFLEQGGVVVVTAAEQNAGKGRFSRTWESPAGVGLYVSYVLKLSKRSLEGLSLVVGLALREALSSICPEKLSKKQLFLKWPNDLYLSNKKLAGILIEVEVVNQQSMLIIGCGINLKSHPSFPISLEDISLRVSAPEILTELSKQVRCYLELYLERGLEHFRKMFEDASFGLGQEVEFKADKESSRGVFCGINSDGAFLLKEFSSGEVRAFYSGSPVFV